MGCCVSTAGTPSSASSPHKHHNIPQSAKASENRAPPEEETVKEVLSETPKWNPPTPTIAKLEPQKSPRKPHFHKVSEVCSLSESMVSTTTVTDRRDEDDEARQRVSASPAKMRKNRSFSGDLGCRGDRTVQSPARRNMGSVRLVQSRDQVGHAIGNRGMRNEPHRRDAGENSGRRSRSPATRTENGPTRSIVGRSPSARRTNQSPARVRTGTPESGHRRKQHASTEGKWPSSATNESLENPLVSLECFIFL
ncbi:serine/arginine repetitive matrix protein 1 [Senna tora]|uniref:Serine/arginine repetitive matrix protein 1 n=1 Tax=Senna tora TaxID=362788 RepID=A0A834SH89_9FABA|nr:serine/arginine repetitive matrix protein 1 [Senna tora]